MENNRAVTVQQHSNKIQTHQKHIKAILMSCNNTFIIRVLETWGFPTSFKLKPDTLHEKPPSIRYLGILQNKKVLLMTEKARLLYKQVSELI